ncbi:MAG: hypothetical protein ACYDGX_05000 [Thermoleophilia bacterium]
MISKKIIFLAALIVAMFFMASLGLSGDRISSAQATSSATPPQVGIWYSTWYSAAY